MENDLGLTTLFDDLAYKDVHGAAGFWPTTTRHCKCDPQCDYITPIHNITACTRNTPRPIPHPGQPRKEYFDILALPQELRDVIYQYSLDLRVRIGRYGFRQFMYCSPEYTATLFTNHQIHEESKMMLKGMMIAKFNQGHSLLLLGTTTKEYLDCYGKALRNATHVVVKDWINEGRRSLRARGWGGADISALAWIVEFLVSHQKLARLCMDFESLGQYEVGLQRKIFDVLSPMAKITAGEEVDLFAPNKIGADHAEDDYWRILQGTVLENGEVRDMETGLVHSVESVGKKTA
ncbi:hypothetical protein EJ08DRAFT_714933 [Tothia fuscella]|uniref:Uncharacterized protein n=1 Tax=Tothia fuscella TaxID=1048955 RepID=A0A9P4U3S3_9PEZI|nr:hypothetical protein EJ08DRAFT_714933 [Tothia fuscella]